ncbi:hypothetical protein LVD17_26795 [Fulvivirga ulvae]|uniref:hypothetical protein n=1 Tax=Fulvivirga ulvae TaxID=2904245 RepID=UPI001F3E8264|nr:hypothetical protein [Fulvivirga ulvae]UII31903.1 hypothetical protein LVD17_26795 [Fulvivirga ulvae]
MNMDVPSCNEIKDLNFWVPPQPSSLMLSIITREGKKVKIDMLPDMDDATDESIPDLKRKRTIYLDDKAVPLKSEAEAAAMRLLSDLIAKQQLGHPQGLAVYMANEMIEYFGYKK